MVLFSNSEHFLNASKLTNKYPDLDTMVASELELPFSRLVSAVFSSSSRNQIDKGWMELKRVFVIYVFYAILNKLNTLAED